MIVEPNYFNSYIGPKAIFDPNYIPKQILFRSQEVHSLYSILKDSFSDNFCLNILYQGIQGIGKKVIINRVLKDLSIQSHNNLNHHQIIVDCKHKSYEDIIVAILTEINGIYNFNLDFNCFINSNISDLWNLFKFVCKKINSNLLFVFNNIEKLSPELLKKLLQYGKEQKISFISTINKVLKPSSLDLLNNFDLTKKLGYYSYQQLFEILKQRVSITFLNQIDKEIVEIITDLIFEHYVPVPGKGIEILKELYPLLNEKSKYNILDILEIIQNQFDTIQLSDEFNLLSYISEEELLTILFLDNISSYFLKNRHYYITSKELKELYYISCETIEYDKILEHFYDIIKKFQSIGILSVSKRNLRYNHKLISNQIFSGKFFFLVINPKRLKTIVDTIFNNF